MALSGSIARRYARALVEIGVSAGTFEQLGREVELVCGLVTGSSELQTALTNPIFPLSQRKSVLDRLAIKLGLHQEVRNFLMLLMDRGRIGQLADITREVAALVDQKAGRVRATVVSAQPLGEELLLTLRGAIEKRLHKKVILEKREDAGLIGGLVAKVGDTLYDGSIRTQLENAKQRLLTE
jgi:F-type H+-transporting ATPase subunit delta